MLPAKEAWKRSSAAELWGAVAKQSIVDATSSGGMKCTLAALFNADVCNIRYQCLRLLLTLHRSPACVLCRCWLAHKRGSAAKIIPSDAVSRSSMGALLQAGQTKSGRQHPGA